MLTRKTNISKSPMEIMAQQQQYKQLFNAKHAPLQGSCSPYANLKGQQTNQQYRQQDIELMSRHKKMVAELNGLSNRQQDSPCKNDYIRSNNRIAKLMGSNKTAAKQGAQKRTEGRSECSSATTAISIVNFDKQEPKKQNQKTSNRSTKNKNSAAQSVKLLGKRKRDKSDLLGKFNLIHQNFLT